MNDNFKVRVKPKYLRGAVGEIFNLEEFNNFEEFEQALLKSFGCYDTEGLIITAIMYNPLYTLTVKQFGWNLLSEGIDWESIEVDVNNICRWLRLTLSERSLINAYLEYSLPYDTIDDTLADAHKSFYSNYDELGRNVALREFNGTPRLMNFIDFNKLADDEINRLGLVRCGGYVFIK